MFVSVCACNISIHFVQINLLREKEHTVKLIDKMSLRAGALKVEGPIAQKGSLASEVTMATKRAPTTQHRHTEEKFSGILTTTHTYLSRGGGEWEQNRQISQSVTNNDPQ